MREMADMPVRTALPGSDDELAVLPRLMRKQKPGWPICDWPGKVVKAKPIRP
jgi:hypothetical protein